MHMFEFEKVFFPVNLTNVHWVLITLFYIKNKRRKMVLFDSMSGSDRIPFQVRFYIFHYSFFFVFIIIFYYLLLECE